MQSGAQRERRPDVAAFLRPRRLGRRRGELAGVPGNIPNLINPPPGCRFAPRCPKAMPVCDTVFPAMTSLQTDHHIACYLYPKS